MPVSKIDIKKELSKLSLEEILTCPAIPEAAMKESIHALLDLHKKVMPGIVSSWVTKAYCVNCLDDCVDDRRGCHKHLPSRIRVDGVVYKIGQ